MPELAVFHTLLHDCLARRAPQEHFLRSMAGQCSDLERQSIAPIALEVEGGNMRAIQRLLSDVVWDEDHLRVCATYASCHGSALVDKRLFLPAGWLIETAATR
jgi:hypothetical protein